MELTEGAIKGLEGEYGGRSSMASVGASVAKDSEAKLSMIRFTHSCTSITAAQTSLGTHTSHHAKGSARQVRKSPYCNALPSWQ